MGDGSLLPPYGLDQKASAGIPGRQSGLEKPGYPLNGSTGVPSLHGRIATELPRFLAAAEAPFAIWHNGAYVQGSFPCARWRFLASPDDFERNRFTAVDAGHDADTVAAMACTVSGAYHGYVPFSTATPEGFGVPRSLRGTGRQSRRVEPEAVRISGRRRSIFGFDKRLRPTHHGALAGGEELQRHCAPEFPEPHDAGGGTGPALR
jgi:hypothetical protein